jgi:hypothetical protein
MFVPMQIMRLLANLQEQTATLRPRFFMNKNFKSHGKKERTHGQKGDANYELVHPMFEKAARNYVKRNGEFEVHVFLNGAGLCNARGKLKFLQGVEKRLFK